MPQVNTHILNMKMRRSEASERLKEVRASDHN
jgi:hypothetical protein